MSDADDVADLGYHAFRTTQELRRRMNEFIDPHEHEKDLKEIRAGVDSMSGLVDDGRTERI